MSIANTNSEFKGEKSKKSLDSTQLITQFQKRQYAEVKERAAQGEPVIWTNVGVPMEILHAMDIPTLFNLHWSALLAAKQKASHYLNVINERGYFRDLCRYCAMPLGYFFENKPEEAPWGGLPKPTAIAVEASDNPIVRIYELMARELNVPFYVWDHTMPSEPPRGNFCNTVEDIEAESYREPWRVDYAVKETEGFLNFIETHSGRQLSQTKLREVMERSNLQFDYIGKTLELCNTVPCPLDMGDHLANLISTQFLRGHEVGLEQAKRIYEETKERVDKGFAACDNEKLRLMHVVVPNWFTPGFYDSFQEEYGAVFTWVTYLPITQQLIRRDLRDPMRALAARYVGYTEMGLLPPWWGQWVVHNAKANKIDGVVYQVAESCRLLSGPMRLTAMALEAEGIPTFELSSDYVDDREWDDQRWKDRLASWIETLQ
jgi:benzoyl-CoA reductase/2-hydroxyglutaryl-CoA dehydratase subunit BcrC/BadD/HgdB